MRAVRAEASPETGCRGRAIRPRSAGSTGKGGEPEGAGQQKPADAETEEAQARAVRISLLVLRRCRQRMGVPVVNSPQSAPLSTSRFARANSASVSVPILRIWLSRSI